MGAVAQCLVGSPGVVDLAEPFGPDREGAAVADQATVEVGRTERTHRRVSIRPAPDTMAILTGYLPVEQGIACYAALRQHADSAVAGGDGRTRDQIMADTMVERITGQTRAPDINIELQVMMPLEALLDPQSNKPATIPEYGPLPADLARNIMITSNGRQVVASPVHCTQQRPYHRRRPGTPYLRWPPGQADTAP